MEEAGPLIEAFPGRFEKEYLRELIHELANPILTKPLDEIVASLGGAVYPAKDARMSPSDFQKFFPQWKTLIQFMDPKFSSSFWRRVTTSNNSHCLMEERDKNLSDSLSKSDYTPISMPFE